MQPVRVKILEKEYLVRSEESAEDVQAVAEYVNQIAEEIREGNPGMSERRIAILTAMHVAGEYFQAMKSSNEKEDRSLRKIREMIFNIDSAMV